jgi:hypothetical protein
MTLSLAGTRRDTGVSIAQVNLKLIWDVLSKIKFSGHGRAYVLEAVGRLIAHPDISLVLRNTDMSQLPQVRSARARVAGNDDEQIEEADDVAGHKVLTASAPVLRSVGSFSSKLRSRRRMPRSMPRCSALGSSFSARSR